MKIGLGFVCFFASVPPYSLYASKTHLSPHHPDFFSLRSPHSFNEAHSALLFFKNMGFFSLLQTGEYVDTTPSMPVRTPAPCFFLSTFGTDKFKSGMTRPVLGREGGSGRPTPPACGQLRGRAAGRGRSRWCRSSERTHLTAFAHTSEKKKKSHKTQQKNKTQNKQKPNP